MSASAKDMLDKLGDAIASVAGIVRAEVDVAGELFTHEAEEGSTADTYTTLRIYGGPSRSITPMPRVSVQSMTVGKVASDAWAQVEGVFASLCDESGRPRVDWLIDGYVIKGVIDLRPLGQIGRDGRDRVQLVFNFDVAYLPVT